MQVGWDQSIALLGFLEIDYLDRNMTEESSKKQLGEVLVIITDFYADISEELVQLSEPAQTNITGYFTKVFLEIPQLAENIYRGLEEPTPPGCGITGFSPNYTMTPETPLDAWTPPGTVFWTGQVYDVEETFLLIHAHNKYLESEVTTSFPADLVLTTSQDFPTFVGDTGVKVIQRTIMFKCWDRSMVTYKIEIEVNTDPIVEPTVKPIY